MSGLRIRRLDKRGKISTPHIDDTCHVGHQPESGYSFYGSERGVTSGCVSLLPLPLIAVKFIVYSGVMILVNA